MPQSALEIIKKWHRHFQHAVQPLRLHLVRVAPPEIAEAIPLVISAIEPDRKNSARLQILVERFDGGLAIRCVVQHAHAVDDVEALRGKRQRENIRLKSRKFAVREDCWLPLPPPRSGQCPTTRAPQRVATSAKRPIPQPTSRTSFPCSSSGRRLVLMRKCRSDSRTSS